MILGTLNPTTSKDLAVLLVRSDGQVWNWDQSAGQHFEALPADGVPTGDHYRAVLKPISKGVLSVLGFLVTPSAVDALGIWVVICPLSGTSIGTPIEMYPYVWTQSIFGVPGGICNP